MFSVPRKKFLFVLCVYFLFFTLILLNVNKYSWAEDQQLLSEKQALPIHSHSPEYGGTLVWGTTDPPTVINPVFTRYSISASLLELIFDSLVRVHPQGHVVPGLAESWEISDDGLEYTFYLKKGVHFHDGVECTAEDVKFTYEAIADPQNNSPRLVCLNIIDRWEIVDKYTIRLVLKKSFSKILHRLTIEIAPKHILDGEALLASPFNYSPVGTGPFRFKAWDRRTDEIELVANEDYFEGRPYLDRILIHIYQDKSCLWAALMRNDVDLCIFLDREDYMTIRNDPAFRTYEITGELYLAIALNAKDPIFFDREVRKAMAYGINVDEIMAYTSSGGIKSTGPFHPGSIGFNPGVRPFEYDPVMARMILMHRGWWDKDHDGIAEKGGRELELRLLVDPRSEFYKDLAMLIRQQLAEIGIKVSVLLHPEERTLEQTFLDQNKPQGWLRYFLGYGFGGYDAAVSWTSSLSPYERLWNYRNDEIDKLFGTAVATQDPQELSEIYQQIHKIVYQDQPACFLFYPSSYHAVAAKFFNTDEFFSDFMPVYTIKDWYLGPAAKDVQHNDSGLK